MKFSDRPLSISVPFHVACITASALLAAPLHSEPEPAAPLDGDWKLIFSDEFEGSEDSWQEHWVADARAHDHILSSRWPENVTIEDGKLRLLNRKETRAGRDWTAGSIWTKQHFRYGYFEARYRIGQAPGLNNSFWIMTLGVPQERVDSGEVTLFEIDINEGHYPNEIATNIHRWSPEHSSDSRKFRVGAEPAASFPLELPVTTSRLRVVSRDPGRVSVAEVRAFSPDEGGYPEMLDAEGNPLPSDRENLLASAQVTASSQLREEFPPSNVIDGVVSNQSRWVAGDEGAAEHELIFELPAPVEIGCVQVYSGWRQRGEWQEEMSDFAIQFWDGSQWVDMASTGGSEGFKDLSADFYTYSLLWTPDELVFYFEGREIRREKNSFCHFPAPVFLSSAVIHWAGPVTDRIDGTSMDVDYVRIWTREDLEIPLD